MSTQIQFQSFNFNSNAVRVITDPNQEFWFCGADVCDILGYTNSRKALQDHCKEKGVTKRYTPSKSGDQEMIFINEPNLYRLIIKSRKPEAEPFEAWVFEEVLPQIRKTGQYALQNAQQNLPLEKPEIRYPAEFTGAEIHSLVWLLISHRNMNNLLGELEQPLAAIGSNFHPTVYSHHHEYQCLIKENLPILRRLIEPFKQSNPIEFERISARLKLN